LHKSRARSRQTQAVRTPAKADKLQATFATALALYQAGRLTEAIALYKRVLLIRPDLPEPHNNLGAALASVGRLEEAAAAYRRAIELNPDNAETHANLGHSLRDLGLYEASEQSFRRAILVGPKNVEAHSGFGTVLMDLGRPAEAEASFRHAIALKPDYAGAYNNLGLALKEAGRLEESRRALERAILLAPGNASYYDNLGAVRPFVAGDPYVATLDALSANAASLPIKDRMHLHFARAKALEDTGRSQDAFRELLAGNALKRRQIEYDDAATLARMDRTRQVFTPDFVEARKDAGVPSSIPVFIVGMPRSGSTLIEQILASHPHVHGAGELNLFEQTVDRLGKRLPGARSFPDIVPAMSDQDFRALGAHYLEKLVQRAPDARRITDKMPANFIFAGLIHLALPNAVIIHAVRDPVDTCVSCFSTHFTRGQPQTYDLAELGRYYRYYRNLMLHWRDVLPRGRIIDVHYEELVADLEGVVRRIVAHCGLEWSARCLDFHRTERTIRTASAVQVRRPIYQSSVGRGRKYGTFLDPLLAELEPGVGCAGAR
jgi:Flp pilus assembly protein TadD/LPS sulfotransferase NodH